MKRLITTPIYYVNDIPHIGHTYTTIICDALSRYYRLRGDEVIFSTGTDEHGEKIEISAKKQNLNPKEFADKISLKFKNLWDDIGISYDKFIRTTDEDHIKAVKYAFEKMYKKGDIYKGEYEGFYCVSCESFYTASQLLDNECCPDCGKKTQILKEESYFFRLSNYEDRLIKWLNSDDVIIPKNKKNEIINFINQGLKDLSITRTSFKWGINLPNDMDDNHIIYVWLDALINYISLLGYPNEDNMEFLKNSIQVVGKDILKFHTIYWPAFLMSLELPLPNKILSHGWWLVNSEKMSKSKGNSINPIDIIKDYGIDELRYYLMREVSFGQDGDFSIDLLINKINNDLNDVLGNLMSRTIGMASKYNDLLVPKLSSLDEELKMVGQISNDAIRYFENYEFLKYLEESWKLLNLGNASIAKYEPWTLMKNNKFDDAMNVVSLCAKILTNAMFLIYPVMPNVANKISNALGVDINTKNFDDFVLNNHTISYKLSQISHLFTKIEISKEPVKEEIKEVQNFIKIDDFKKCIIKVGKILECDNVEGSNKLLKFKIDLGDNDIRQIISGIAKFYNPADLVGKSVCVLSNLKPAKIMGHISEGMILSAESDGELSLISSFKDVKNGSVIG